MIIFYAGDGFSQLPVSLECTGNNTSETLLSWFYERRANLWHSQSGTIR